MSSKSSTTACCLLLVVLSVQGTLTVDLQPTKRQLEDGWANELEADPAPQDRALGDGSGPAINDSDLMAVVDEITMDLTKDDESFLLSLLFDAKNNLINLKIAGDNSTQGGSASDGQQQQAAVESNVLEPSESQVGRVRTVVGGGGEAAEPEVVDEGLDVPTAARSEVQPTCLPPPVDSGMTVPQLIIPTIAFKNGYPTTAIYGFGFPPCHQCLPSDPSQARDATNNDLEPTNNDLDSAPPDSTNNDPETELFPPPSSKTRTLIAPSDAVDNRTLTAEPSGDASFTSGDCLSYFCSSIKCQDWECTSEPCTSGSCMAKTCEEWACDSWSNASITTLSDLDWVA